jgi:hypothetical protein
MDYPHSYIIVLLHAVLGPPTDKQHVSPLGPLPISYCSHKPVFHSNLTGNKKMYTDWLIMLRVPYQIHLVTYISSLNYSLICDGLHGVDDGLWLLSCSEFKVPALRHGINALCRNEKSKFRL